jgi:hypothetical protein
VTRWGENFAIFGGQIILNLAKAKFFVRCIIYFKNETKQFIRWGQLWEIFRKILASLKTDISGRTGLQSSSATICHFPFSRQNETKRFFGNRTKEGRT